MIILVLVLFIFGIYAFVKRARGEKLPEEAQAFGGRLGRSVHGALPLAGLTGQPPASMMPGPAPDEIGPESSHILVIKGPDDTKEGSSSNFDLDEVRARLDAILPPDRPRVRRRSPPRRQSPEG